MNETPKATALPVIPARNVVVFPGHSLPLTVGRRGSVKALERAWKGDKEILIVTQKEADLDNPAAADLYEIGTVCSIEKIRGNSKEGYQVLVHGIRVVRVIAWDDQEPIEATETVPHSVTEDLTGRETAAYEANLRQLAHEILALIPADTSGAQSMIDAISEFPLLLNVLCEHLEAPIAVRQQLLATTSLRTKTATLLERLGEQRERLKLQTQIRRKLNEKLGQTQREAFLREQLKTIRDELQEHDGHNDLESRLAQASLPDAVRKIAEDEARRLAAMGTASPEAGVIRSYLELILALPWDETTGDNLDLAHARNILERDHYGLDKVKERIVQHLAVMKLKKKVQGSILLLVGPPGVGKTSLGRSVADALGRQYERVSLGGVRDDAEIRGHRRTYVGAMPGRIIQALKRAGSKNPVIVLDEVDKLGRGFQGDPAAALLEVLDPEQNNSFFDHYLDVPFDLSQVFFLATANSLEGIPAPLLDRMEVIRLSGYTGAEKLHIAKRHLLPKAREQAGIPADKLQLTDAALTQVIERYTREAGVRQLSRELAAIARTVTERILEGEAVEVDGPDVNALLGTEKHRPELANLTVPPGVATGLAWTPVGGDILFVEAGRMPGKGGLTLTGQLGDVMKESAQIALSLVRGNLSNLITGVSFDKFDWHLHVPAGAIPKDGPSAGVTMLVAIASLLSGHRVDPRLAMTGEITLRGAVLPVGGIKEKVIAAHRAGIRRVLLPQRNDKDLAEIPQEVRNDISIVWVDDVADVLQHALGLEVTSGDATPLPRPPEGLEPVTSSPPA